MKRRTPTQGGFGVAFLDLLSCGLVAVLIVMVSAKQEVGDLDPRLTVITFIAQSAAGRNALPQEDQMRLFVRVQVDGTPYTSADAGDDRVRWRSRPRRIELLISGELPETLSGQIALREERSDVFDRRGVTILVTDDFGAFESSSVTLAPPIYFAAFSLTRS